MSVEEQIEQAKDEAQDCLWRAHRRMKENLIDEAELEAKAVLEHIERIRALKGEKKP